MSFEETRECQERHHDDLAAYALGALDGSAAKELEAHLESCEACSDRLRWLQPAIDLMPASVPQLEAPPSLKLNLMDVVREEAAVEGAPAPAQRQRAASPVSGWWERLRESMRLRPALAGLATLAAVVVGVTLIAGGGADSRVGKTFAANAVTGGSNATGLVRVEEGHGLIEVQNLPPTSPRSTYQVWVAHDGQVSPSSTFEISKDGTGESTIPELPAEADQIIVTREPAGGSKSPRGPQMLSADLS